MLGFWYGDAAIGWMATKLGPEGPRITGHIQLWFGRAAYPIVVLAPNGYVCLVAGATGMRPAVFVILNSVGTIAGLVLVWLAGVGSTAGSAFDQQITAAVRFVSRHQWWLTGLSAAVVAMQIWRGRRRRALPFQTAAELAQGLSDDVGLDPSDEHPMVEETGSA